METKTKLTQRDIILWHLQNVGTLTRAQAMMEYGIVELPARIVELKRLGYKIKKFLTIGYGSGYGYGDGDGYGYGDGYGSGYGLKSFGGSPVHYIDGLPTVILRVHGNLAKGFIVKKDLTTQECFVAKGENKFAHGETFVKAQKALQDKIFDDMDTEEKIDAFLKVFEPNRKYPAKSFYEWHHKLTGSCEFGRNAFVKNHGIDIESGMYSVEEFIEYTENDYGGDIIQRLKERMEE